MVSLPVKSSIKNELTRAAVLAACSEALIIAGVVWALAQARQHVEPPAIPVMIKFPALPTPPKPVEKKPPKPVEHHVVHHVPQPKPQPVPLPKPPVPEAKPTPQALPQPPKVTAPKVEKPKPAAPITPPAPPQPDPHLLATFNDQVLGAVQAAVQYPFAARMAHMQGRTRVRFNYLDGVVSNVTVVTTSGYDILDDAAIQAVMNAHYPTPPASLKGKILPFTLWVVHHLHSQE